PCAFIENEIEKNRRIRRDSNAGNLDIHALQTTINDHRTMIYYLINNSMNATYVTNAISSHHSNTGPILTTWRELIDAFVITLCMGFFIYLLMCHAACSPSPASITPTPTPTQRIITPDSMRQTPNRPPAPTATIIEAILRNRNKQNELSTFPQFQARNQYELYLVNRTADTDALHHLIQLAQNIEYFTIDTEADLHPKQSSLIQVEFISQHISTIILVEKKNTIYIWGDPIKELSTFVTYGLFTSDEFQIEKLVNMQHKFKKWFRRQHQFDPTGGNLWGLQPAFLLHMENFWIKPKH
ncbi:unnamed protein product, partial [Rotaria magnacalcarata]